MTIRALEFYSGIGGLHLALSRSTVDGEVIGAFDWDQTACAVYSLNHGKNIVHKIDISTLSAPALAAYDATLWLLSPACQPYTVLNPNAKGAADPRAHSFLHLVQNVLPELARSNQHPHRLIIENVAGFEDSSTRQILVSTLRTIGYRIVELLLTPLQFGIPNSRLRYYLLAKTAPLCFAHVLTDSSGGEDRIWRQIPGVGLPWTDPRFEDASDTSGMVAQLRVYLDTGDEEHYLKHKISDRILQKWGRLFDIVKPSSRRTCCFTRGYTQLVERAGSILQENEDLDTTSVFDTFLQAQSLGDSTAASLLEPLRLRYFSPSELLRIFAFNTSRDESVPESMVSTNGIEVRQLTWPNTVSTKSRYKLIGNSVNVHVVQQLIEYLFREPKMN
ncbi:hypothetical protein HYPSUDRAFT_137529 [Hypholoma sublateritium FD-334 SS-4]|uniref:tRNA (cytosine(38)-C(5))-methyltransferase n=1 Tax=Hypholoma sublateritium (strain FD-334 SS-4) TaxID=945553 RepID=A0A0D2P4B2_HYPSF|nr:hypothetical protein HYPSUDRAFT_137529 [Hypholoma sublateritium FD-334 SS-4]